MTDDERKDQLLAIIEKLSKPPDKERICQITGGRCLHDEAFICEICILYRNKNEVNS